jgi:hypothetical protein
MEKISEFMNMEVYMHFNKYMSPFIILHYGNMRALITIETIELVSGNVPNRQVKIAMGWIALHQHELMEAWDMMIAGLELVQIAPLKG